MILGSFSIGAPNLNSLQKSICCLTTASAFLLLPTITASAQSDECSFLESPQEFNTVENEDRRVIGRDASRPYIVLLTHDLQENLPAIRACIPDAFVTSSRLGSYLHIASFSAYGDARELVNFINESLELDVRIIHRARLGE